MNGGEKGTIDTTVTPFVYCIRTMKNGKKKKKHLRLGKKKKVKA